MAAYAAVVSVLNNMEQMQNHPYHSFSFDKEQIECLRKNVGFLLRFLESYSHGGSKEAEALESRIASAAQEADDVIESHIVDQILAGSTLHVETSFGELFEHFLDYLEYYSRGVNKEAEALESQIASAALEADDAIKSHTVDDIIVGIGPGKSIMSLCLDFLETYSHGGSIKAEAPESQIASASAVNEADDVVESHIVDQSLAGSTLHEETSLGERNKSLWVDFLEAYSDGGSQEGEASESQITSAAHEADDVVVSHIIGRILAGSTLHAETSLGEMIKSHLQDFLETSSHGGSEEAEASSSQIESAAHDADDVIKTHIVDQILAAGFNLHGETSLGEQIISRLQDSLQTSSHGDSEEAEASESQIASAAQEHDDAIESHIVDEILAGSTLRQEASRGKQIMSLCQDFVETSSHGGSKETEASESHIASAAHDSDDVIESHSVDQSLAGSTLHGETCSCSLVDLQKVIESMDSVKQMVMKVESQRDFIYPTPAASSRPLTPGKSAMVGFDNELIQLLDLLTGLQSSRQIISITGMGGIGKTTLSKTVYENSIIVHHFDIRIWAAISQESSTKKNLSELLLCLGKLDDEIDQKLEDELGEQLYKALSGRRYLIILDDIWSVEAWDNIRVFFPDNNNRSRIVITSRQSDVANHLGSSCIALNCLDEEKSWNLFCQKTFSDLDCPHELEEPGKKIVKKCKGLPLLIVLFGGHLGKTSMMKEYWENFGNDITSNLNCGEDEQCFDILSLSYNYLPAHLKPCFLYMGIFPEDYEISVSTLVKLWVAEGFLKPSKTQSLEEIAEGCLEDLVDRNLISVLKLRWNGKIKTCSIHDLLRELCLKVAAKEKFFRVLNLHQAPPPLNNERRLVVHGSTPREDNFPEIFHAMESANLARSLLCYSTDKGQPCSIDYRLLKVMQSVEGVADELEGKSFMELNLQQVNLRYLYCRMFHIIFPLMSNLMQNPPKPILPLCLPSSISMLWNLQTLIVSGYPVIVAPPEIWKMPQLRHIAVIGLRMPEPPLSDDVVALENLQTVFEVINLRLSEDVCKRIPNIKKLRIGYSEGCEESSYYSPNNLDCLQKLESLRCSFAKESNWRHFSLRFTFPSSLRKLCLENCFLDWDDLTMIGSLPNLEVLKLLRNAAVGSEWNLVEGEFLRLKFLKISSCSDLIYWNAESCNFPVLEKLDFEGLSALDEIPSDIGEIPTLQFIRLKYCSVSSAASAMRILVEQESLGNEDLRVEVMFSEEEQLKSFREIVQEEDLSSNNLHIAEKHSLSASRK